MPESEGIAKALRAPLLKTFPPALLGRIVSIPYYPLSDAVLGQIIRLQLGRIVARIQANHGAQLSYGEDVVKLIAARCTEPESGGRMIDAIVTNTLLPAISRELLNRISAGQRTRRIGVSVADGEFAYTFE
jgi:type VI secretion system protein VasG